MQQLFEATNIDGVRECATEILYGIPRATGFIRRHMRKHRKGLSVPQFRTLLWVDRHPGETLSAVAEFLGATLPSASRVVDGLVSRGLLTRTARADDRRQVSLTVTPPGQEVLAPAWSATRHVVEERLAMLSSGERETIHRGMQLLMAALCGEGSSRNDIAKD